MATNKPRTASAARQAAKAQRKAATERKRAERREYRRFTQQTRQRRAALTAGIGGVVVVAVLTVVLTTSPILSLRSVKVEGTERLARDVVVDALQPLTGEPLARVSPDDVVTALSDIALIQSIETRLELPGTLVVTITERTPIGAIQNGAGFQVVDRAAVVLFEAAARPTEFPLIGVAPNPESRGFQAIGEALAVIPPEVLSRIDRVSASSADTVAFSLRDSDHRVLWGSSEASTEKARVLPAALRTAGDEAPQLIDLSTPDTVVIRDVDNPLPTPQAPDGNLEGDTSPGGESSEANGDTP